MRTCESFLALIAELEGDCRELARILAQNSRAWERIQNGANDPIDWGALGFTIHSAYGILENYFLRISKFFENGLPPDRWHRALVEKMALGIIDIRPALLPDEASRTGALELLRFRHRFRNLYGEDLDPKKTAEVQKTALEFGHDFQKLHAEFIEKLRAISRELE